jgi:hypothetical protein
MKEEFVKAIFLLAGIDVEKIYRIENKYDRDPERPWWLVKTKWGLIEIGWRKRVINIDWSDTPLRIKKDVIREYEFHMLSLTPDQTDQGDTYIHAWNYGDAINYLVEFRHRMGNWEYATSPEGVIDLADRKKKYEENKAKSVEDPRLHKV